MPRRRQFLRGMLAGAIVARNVESFASERLPNARWYAYSDSDTVFVFVHGIFSNSIDCWTAENGAYWPEIILRDTRFARPAIFLGGYYTDFSSGIYRIPDAANELLSYLKTEDEDGRPPAIDKRKIVFLAHSTGGLVVRYAIERYQQLFTSKSVGLFLLASPSRGSAWANRLAWIRQLYDNKMAGQLARDNDFMVDLDSRFADLVSQKRIPSLVGIDLFENKFIVRGPLSNVTHVVSAQDSASYIGAYKIVPNSDHFSIAKPRSRSDSPHQMLWDFYQTIFKPSVKDLAASVGSELLNLLAKNPTIG